MPSISKVCFPAFFPKLQISCRTKGFIILDWTRIRSFFIITWLIISCRTAWVNWIIFAFCITAPFIFMNSILWVAGPVGLQVIIVRERFPGSSRVTGSSRPSAIAVVSFLPVIVNRQPVFANAEALCYLNFKGLPFEFLEFYWAGELWIPIWLILRHTLAHTLWLDLCMFSEFWGAGGLEFWILNCLEQKHPTSCAIFTSFSCTWAPGASPRLHQTHRSSGSFSHLQ